MPQNMHGQLMRGEGPYMKRKCVLNAFSDLNLQAVLATTVHASRDLESYQATAGCISCLHGLLSFPTRRNGATLQSIAHGNNRFMNIPHDRRSAAMRF